MNLFTFFQRQTKRRLYALIALVTEKPVAATACPTDSQFAAFIEGRLQGQAREIILQHLRTCPICYQHWQTVVRYTQPPRWSPNWRYWLTSQVKQYALPLGWAIAATVVITVSLLWFLPPSVHQQLDTSYQYVLTQQDETTKEILLEFQFRWQKITGYGFSERYTTEAMQAFAAGLLIGKQVLLTALSTTPHTPWLETSWADYVALGRWSVLLWEVCQSQRAMSDHFWQTQRAILKKLRASFLVPHQTKQPLIERLNQIEQLMRPLPTHTFLPLYHPLGRELSLLMDQLAPATLEAQTR
jgi:hypothetical protein